jgi:perosamine synthetase
VKIDKKSLAINGGEKFRQQPMPYRRLFAEPELDMITCVFEDSWANERDFSYQGKFEKMFCDDFVEFLGGGYADAVSSGTLAFLVALQALKLKPGGEIIFSPVTDPGGFTPAIFSGFQAVIADSVPNSYLMGVQQFRDKITDMTVAVVVTHVGGLPAEIDKIVALAQKKNIRVIEDCSQAHGAMYKGQKVGTFGDVAFFSTMFSKLIASGGCGGLVYTNSQNTYEQIRMCSDRGKRLDSSNDALKDPRTFAFSAMNCNQDELSSAIGVSTLKKLPATIERRLTICSEIEAGLAESQLVRVADWCEYSDPALFFITFFVETERLSVSKLEFAEAVRAEGIEINPDYGFVISEWQWASDSSQSTPNASKFRKSSFNLLFNENYGEKEIEDIVGSILKVEYAFSL